MTLSPMKVRDVTLSADGSASEVPPIATRRERKRREKDDWDDVPLRTHVAWTPDASVWFLSQMGENPTCSTGSVARVSASAVGEHLGWRSDSCFLRSGFRRGLLSKPERLAFVSDEGGTTQALDVPRG